MATGDIPVLSGVGQPSNTLQPSPFETVPTGNLLAAEANDDSLAAKQAEVDDWVANFGDTLDDWGPFQPPPPPGQGKPRPHAQESPQPNNAKELFGHINGNNAALVLFKDQTEIGVSLIVDNNIRHADDVLAEIVTRELTKNTGKPVLSGAESEILRSLVEVEGRNKGVREVKIARVFSPNDPLVSGFFRDSAATLSVCCMISVDTDGLEYSIRAPNPPQFTTSLERFLKSEQESRLYVLVLGCCVGLSFVTYDAARAMPTLPQGTSLSQLIPPERVAAWGVAGLGTVWFVNALLNRTLLTGSGGATITYKSFN